MNKENIRLRRLGDGDVISKFDYADALGFYDKMGFSPLSKEDEGAPTRLMYFDLEGM